MARISLKCDCGWSFFIAESTQGSQVTCPNCSHPVDIPGRAAGEVRLSAGEIAAKKIQQAKTTKMLIFSIIGVVAIGGIIVLWMIGGGDDSQTAGMPGPRPKGRTKAPYPRNPTNPPSKSTSGTSGVRTMPPPPDSTPLPFPPRKKSETPDPKENTQRVDVQFYSTQINDLIYHINMRGIVAETLRLKGLPAAREEVLKKLQEDEARVQAMLKTVTDAGHQLDIPGRMKVDDRILAMGDQKVAGVAVVEGRGVLEGWLRRFRVPVLIQEIHVARGGQQVTLYVGFQKETTELLKLARFPDTLPEGNPPPVNPGLSPVAQTGPNANPFAPQATIALPGEIIEDIRGRFGLLPKGYYLLLAVGDRTRLERLEKSGAGTPHDRQFLVNLQQKVLPRFEAEAADFRSKVRNLQAKVMSEAVAVDVVHFKSPPGRKVQGKVVSETDTHVEVKLRFGAVKYAKAEILKIEKGGGAGGEFPGRYKKAKGNLKALQQLLDWCKDNNLRLEREFVGYQILIQDPTHEPARKAVRRPAPLGFVGDSAIPPRAVPRRSAIVNNTGFSPDKAVAQRIEMISREVATAHPNFRDVISQVRSRTAGLRHSTLPAPPPAAHQISGTIQDPLTFDPARLPTSKAIEVANWWGRLTPTERQSFARFYGLWCAYRRTRG